MKRLVLLFIIFFTAVSISPFLIGEKGYILIAMGNFTIESTVVTASIFLFISFLCLLLLLRLCLGGIHFGKGTWRKITFASQRKAHKNFKQGVTSYLIEDYNDAEKHLIKSAERASEPSTAYLLAASSAQKQTNEDKSANIEYYVKCLLASDTKTADIEHVLVAIKLQIQLKNFSAAEQLLTQYHTNIGHDNRLLVLAIELAVNQEHFQQAIDYLPKAYKAKVFNLKEMYDIEFKVYQGHFLTVINEKAIDGLTSLWKTLSRKEKNKQSIVLAYCNVLVEQELPEPVEALILPLLQIDSDESLIIALKQLPIKMNTKLFKIVQKYVQKAPENTMWLSYFAFLAFHSEQLDVAIKTYSQLFSNTSYQNQQDTKLYIKALIQTNEHQLACQVMLNNLLVK